MNQDNVPVPTIDSNPPEPEVPENKPNIVHIEVSNEPEEYKQIRDLLQSMGVEQYEPNVIPMLIEYARNYLKIVTDDAKSLAYNGSRPFVNSEDITLASSLYSKKHTRPVVSRTEALKTANALNNTNNTNTETGILLPRMDKIVSGCTYTFNQNNH